MMKYTVHGNLPMHYPDFRTTPVHLSGQHKEPMWLTIGTGQLALIMLKIFATI